MHTRQSIAEMLNRSNEAVERAIIRIFSFQTDQEKNAESTLNDNKVGFSACHGATGSYYAKWILSGKRLSGIHLVKARKMALAYTRQLAEYANSKEKHNG